MRHHAAGSCPRQTAALRRFATTKAGAIPASDDLCGSVVFRHAACICPLDANPPEFLFMKSSSFRACFQCLCLFCGTLVSAGASADAAQDLTAKGNVNVNDQRPQLP